jgi:hypothetical protein
VHLCAICEYPLDDRRRIYCDDCRKAFGTRPARATHRFVRRIWAMLDAYPGASVRQLAAIAGLRSWSNVGKAMQELAAMGVIERTPNRSRAWRLVQPYRGWFEG